MPTNRTARVKSPRLIVRIIAILTIVGQFAIGIPAPLAAVASPGASPGIDAGLDPDPSLVRDWSPPVAVNRVLPQVKPYAGVTFSAEPADDEFCRLQVFPAQWSR